MLLTSVAWLNIIGPQANGTLAERVRFGLANQFSDGTSGPEYMSTVSYSYYDHLFWLVIRFHRSRI